ncbi:MAG TPA: FAD-dependent monooxygenase [Burkholderiales bacterium]|nr:FAD-dependent monooxygenase [Burkholderiales bacterium]
MRHDLIVVGGGPVGAALARAARGLSVALVGDPPRAAAPAADAFDARVYALSPGNVAFLRSLGAWDAVDAGRVTPVHAMSIYGDDGRARLEFDALEGGVAELAWIVEDGALLRALWGGLADVEVLAGASCERLVVDAERVSLFLAGGRSLDARLVVGADGAQSFVRHEAGIAARESDYGQAALVANFRCGRPHGNTARQWFQKGGGVLALLPLPRAQVSMVWSLAAGDAQRLGGMAADALAGEATQASHGMLGDLAAASPVRSYALRRLAARPVVAPRIALAGDAAHVIHPLAGQGLNLGLQDARVLAEVLARREPGRDPGEHRLLRRYERQRAEPVLAMDGLVHGLFRLYSADNAWLARLRNAGLNLTDRLPVLKNVLMRRAMS